MTTEAQDAPGNLGILDQRLALIWIQSNIQKFGGDPMQITLMGHGTSGAANAFIHLSISNTLPNLFSKIIIMSGSIFSPWSFQVNRLVVNPSVAVIKNLACDSTNPTFTLECLRTKSVTDLLKAFENVYKVC